MQCAFDARPACALAYSVTVGPPSNTFVPLAAVAGEGFAGNMGGNPNMMNPNMNPMQMQMQQQNVQMLAMQMQQA